TREGVARGGIAAAHAHLEPRRSLGGGAVGPRLGVDRLTRRPLDPVVTDRIRGLQRLVAVARPELATPVDRLRPDTGQAVGLALARPRRPCVASVNRTIFAGVYD